MSKETKKMKAFILRLPEGLYKKVEAQAKTDDRSVNMEIISILKKVLRYADS